MNSTCRCLLRHIIVMSYRIISYSICLHNFKSRQVKPILTDASDTQQLVAWYPNMTCGKLAHGVVSVVFLAIPTIRSEATRCRGVG